MAAALGSSVALRASGACKQGASKQAVPLTAQVGARAASRSDSAHI